MRKWLLLAGYVVFGTVALVSILQVVQPQDRWLVITSVVSYLIAAKFFREWRKMS